MLYLLLLLALVILCGLWWRSARNQTQFLQQLTQALLQQSQQRTPLILKNIPPVFEPLSRALQELLEQLPANNGRDRLTGLPNRVGFKRAMVPLMPLTAGAFVLLDVHRFRFINDLFGFAFGDQLLVAFAERLKQLHHSPRFIARLDGDEFLLLFDEPMDESALNGLKGRLQVPFKIQDTLVSLKLHLGALDLERFHTDISQMLRRLDLALKKARRAQDGLACYAEGDDVAQLRELKIINSLPKALKSGQLYLVYQPKFSIKAQGCDQLEALIRWDHPELGRLSPAEFIPLAEYAGAIGLVSHWALEQALAQQQRWYAEGLRVRVAVNLSAGDLENLALVEEVQDRLAHYDLPGEALALEITEGSLMNNLHQAGAMLIRLRALGIKVAIDDFGTGHSSLAYLKHLPVDEVKIDRSFLLGMENDESARQILHTSIKLARQLGFEVTVEGVETQNQLRTLKAMGADRIQGLLIASPMQAPELESARERLQLPRQAEA
ncbi:putative bifunctional diguanylate cyclase/phosphodiesterase [Shewanella cyperi]|uniref:putative bifunctional diguanylate cyclase/phosphodiesterase n=1 Tax=Shewanella cyperi TaxID=2814292 RepID=UPI001A940C67|nr:bifunctional diguanylate cyclase/phosphodiesterase [Shewanella cyperi]QSX41710.1 bifunctional diguanylate cyclase/phosphodiesterase [Shewanella cyperi]